MEEEILQGQTEEPVETAEPVEDVPASEQITVEEQEVIDEGLPEDASERTKREFEKLKEKNREMSEKLSKHEKREAKNALEDVFSGLAKSSQQPVASPQPVPQPQEAQNVIDDYIDAQGNVDVNGLNAALRNANYTAQQAAVYAQQAVAQTQRQAEQAQVREAHNAHPWLDPTSADFDEDSYELVKDRLMRNWAEGKDVPLSEVASQISSRYRKSEPIKEEKAPISAAKAQSASVSSGRGQNRVHTKVDVDELRSRAQNRDLSAVDELIRRATE